MSFFSPTRIRRRRESFSSSPCEQLAALHEELLSLVGPSCVEDGDAPSHSDDNSTRLPVSPLQKMLQWRPALDQLADESSSIHEECSSSRQSYATNKQQRRLVELIQRMQVLLLSSPLSTTSSMDATTATTTSSTVSPTSNLQQNDVFEYFAQHHIWELWVDMVLGSKSKTPAATTRGCPTVVQTQILTTLATLVERAATVSTLYYYLSQPSLLRLLKQFPQSVCSNDKHQQQEQQQEHELLTAAWLQLLGQLTRHVEARPQLNHLFVLDHHDEESFPLLQAVLSLTMMISTTDYHTCLSMLAILLPLYKNNSNNSSLSLSLQHLSQHLMDTLHTRYTTRLVACTTGPVVVVDPNTRACRFLKEQQIGQDLHAFLQVVQDFLLWNPTTLAVPLCEQVVQYLLDNNGNNHNNRSTTNNKNNNVLSAILPPFLPDVGVHDSDVVPEREAWAQVTVWLLGQLFVLGCSTTTPNTRKDDKRNKEEEDTDTDNSSLSYPPLQRMLSVLLFHPLVATVATDNNTVTDYPYTRALNDLVMSSAKNRVIHQQQQANVYRAALLQTLRGDYGIWRIPAVAWLLEQVLATMDDTLLSQCQLLQTTEPTNEKDDCRDIAQALVSFFQTVAATNDHTFDVNYDLWTTVHGCMTSLAIQFIIRSSSVNSSAATAVLDALIQAKASFFARLVQAERDQIGFLLVDWLEEAVAQHYTLHRASHQYRFCVLRAHHAPSVGIRYQTSAQRPAGRFHAHMAIQYRAMVRIAQQQRNFGDGVDDAKTRNMTKNHTSISHDQLLVDLAGDDLTRIFRCVQPSLYDDEGGHNVSTELDLNGRMTFEFLGPAESDSSISSWWLVLDPTHLLVVQSSISSQSLSSTVGSHRGTVVCSIPLLQVIACAADGDGTLHVAIQQDPHQCFCHARVEPWLVCNGNMALVFSSKGTSLVVQRYLERSRQVLRQELLGKIRELCWAEQQESSRSSTSSSTSSTSTSSDYFCDGEGKGRENRETKFATADAEEKKEEEGTIA